MASGKTSADELVVTIDAGGTIRFVWDDCLAPLAAEGRATIVRASQVEPTPEGLWEADMAMSGGGVLGPFSLRGGALAAERRWLRERLAI